MNIQPKQPTVPGPSDWFTGDVWVDAIVRPNDESHVNMAAVRFPPGARSAWHSHQGGQTLYVTEGRGLVQSRGEAITEIGPGDVIWTADGDEHWHGAAPDRFMTHLSITTGATTWGHHVTDAEYGGGA